MTMLLMQGMFVLYQAWLKADSEAYNITTWIRQKKGHQLEEPIGSVQHSLKSPQRRQALPSWKTAWKYASKPEEEMVDHPWMLQTRISTANQKMDRREHIHRWTRAYTQIPKLSNVQIEMSPQISMSGPLRQPNSVGCLWKNYHISKQEQFADQATFLEPGSWYWGPEKPHRHKFRSSSGHLVESTLRREDQRIPPKRRNGDAKHVVRQMALSAPDILRYQRRT